MALIEKLVKCSESVPPDMRHFLGLSFLIFQSGKLDLPTWLLAPPIWNSSGSIEVKLGIQPPQPSSSLGHRTLTLLSVPQFPPGVVSQCGSEVSVIYLHKHETA